MTSFPIVDLIAGLIFVYFILSIISSSVVEVVLTMFKLRGRILGKWLLTIFDKKVMQPDGKIMKLGQAIMDHCLTTALSKEGKAASFMDAKNFVSALIEKITYNPNVQLADVNVSGGQIITDLDSLLDAIRNNKALDGTPLLSTELQRTLLIFGDEARLTALEHAGKTSFQLFRDKMENWFDTSMDRITGKMKKKYARPITFWIGTMVVIGLNADTIAISKYLYSNPDARAKAAAAAYNIPKDEEIAHQMQHLDSVSKGLPDEAKRTQEQLMQSIQDRTTEIKANAAKLNDVIPLGWNQDQIIYWKGHKFSNMMGWLATIMAVMLGAPFWFDLLNKIANIRGSGAKPPSTTDKQRKQSSTDK